MFWVYCIENTINGKKYVGQTCNIKTRFWQHRTGKTNKYLKHAIKKHNLYNFRFSILKQVSSRSLADYFEKHYINYYECLAPNGYNIVEGGYGKAPWNKGLRGVMKAWNRGIPSKNRKPIVATHMATGETIEYPCSIIPGFNSGHIIQCCKKKLKSHKGFYWRYKHG